MPNEVTTGTLIEKGSFGEVFLGQFRGKSVAVKVINLFGSGLSVDLAVQEIMTLM